MFVFFTVLKHHYEDSAEQKKSALFNHENIFSFIGGGDWWS